MKKLKYFILVAIVASFTGFYSCETFELELVEDPNALAEGQQDPDLLLNSIQLAYKDNQTTFNNLAGQLSRTDAMTGTNARNYFAYLNSTRLNGVWRRFYSNSGVSNGNEGLGMLINMRAITDLNTSNPNIDLSFHEGVAKTLVAHNLMELVDWLGDIPWSQAGNPVEFPTPEVDDDQDVYNAAVALLNEALTNFNNASNSGTAIDFYYDGDIDKWKKLANTIKMRAHLTTKNYQAVLDATNVLATNADDFEFKYGTQALTPDTRHPDYISDYRSDGANIYKSNWLMRLMMGDDISLNASGQLPDADPRRRYYFYRQNWRTPGNCAWIEDINGAIGAAGDILQFCTDGNGETLSCSLQDTPVHLQFTPDENIWCSLPLGYWGRLHGNDEGTPPDNFTRTASGVYPAGGSFDGREDAFPFVGESISETYGQQVGLGNGGGGAGIEPIYLASYVDFMKAEAALALGQTAQAATFLENGLTKSIEKVQTFSSLDPAANSAVIPSSTEVSTFISNRVTAFNNAPTTSALDGNGFPVEKDKLDILGEQYFVTIFGGAADAFNFIRRTGYPRTLSRNIDPNPGSFPRTVLYPNIEVISNPNITQRTDLSTLVFWDSGTTNPAN